MVIGTMKNPDLSNSFCEDFADRDYWRKHNRKINCMAELAKRKEARTCFWAFVKFIKPDFFLAPFHYQICQEIDKWIDSPEHLTLSMPPRHGKSELLSRLLPAYLLGRFPDAPIVLGSYSQQLANKNMRDCLRLMSSPKYTILFPNTILPTRLDKGYLSRQDFTELVHPLNGHEKYGSIKACGVGSSLTGFGCRYLILDDCTKDREEANSAIVREKLIDWYSSVARTRLDDKKGKICILGTRFHTNDLIGSVTSNQNGDLWRSVNFSAIATNDEQFRKTGEPLWAEKFDEKALKLIRKSIGEVEWSCLYQQQPITAGTTAFTYDNPQLCYEFPNDTRQSCIIAVDPSLGGKGADLSSICVMMRCAKTKKLFVDSWHQSLKTPQLLERICDLALKYKPEAIALERNGFQSLLLQPLQDLMAKRLVYARLIGVNNSVDKKVRILRIGHFLQHLVFVDNEMNKELIQDIKSYPILSGNDDRLDALEMAHRSLVEVTNEKMIYAR
jgi:predicted phage terminase large subunit-like protein